MKLFFLDISNQINSNGDAWVQNSEFVKPLYRPPKKNLSKINSDLCMIKEIKQQTHQSINSQAELDNLWAEVKGILICEMSSFPDLSISN